MNGYLNAIALTVDYMIEGETPTNMDHLKEDVIAAIKRDEARDKENAALKARVAELEKYKEFHGLVCTITATNFIKANAIREAIVEARDAAQMYDRSGVIEFCTVEDLNEHADKVERGESC